MTDIDTLIAEVLRLDGEATPGPWHRRDAETENGYMTSAVSPDMAEDDGLEPCDLPIAGRTVTTGISGNDAALCATYRTAAPLLAAEVQRLRADLEKSTNALDFTRQWYASRMETIKVWGKANGHWDLLASLIANDGDPPTFARMLAMSGHDRDRAHAEVWRLRSELEEARLTLAAEQGRQEGAPVGWEYSGQIWHRGRRRAKRCGDGWEWWFRGDYGVLIADGRAQTARAAMLAADAATTPPGPAPRPS